MSGKDEEREGWKMSDHSKDKSVQEQLIQADSVQLRMQIVRSAVAQERQRRKNKAKRERKRLRK